MKSFPSTLNKGGYNAVTNNSGQNIVSTILSQFSNSFKSAFQAGIMAAKNGMSTSGTMPDTSLLPYNVEQDTTSLFANHAMDIDNSISISFTTLGSGINPEIRTVNSDSDNTPLYAENPFKFDRVALHMLNTYKWKIGDIDIVSSASYEQNGEQLYFGSTTIVAPSLFNPYFGVNILGLTKNTPLLDTQTSNTNHLHANFTDCRIKKLVEMSNDPNDTELGAAKYKYVDFMFCKDLGMPNNRLITLRKFTTPIGDNIFYGGNIDNFVGSISPLDSPSDVGRMCCYFDTEDNKLEDIMKYEYSASWKKLDAKIDQQQSKEDDRVSPLGMVINTISPSYNKSVAQSISSGNNSLYGWLKSTLGLKNAEAWYTGNPALTNYDQNKVYTPKDTIQETHIYEGKLEFKHNFTLVFSYKMRSYDNINQKAAFLDLLGNILTTTYTRGSFWGGRNEIIGPSPNTSGWKTAKGLVDKTKNGLSGIFSSICNGNINLQSFLGSFSNVLNSLGGVMSKVTSALTVDNIKAATSNLVTKFNNAGGGAALCGLLENVLGRPQLYAFNSLLTGDNVGLWHVTIGNPRNPIAVFGNLILKNATIQHFGPLGIDDFPTEIKVTVDLEHARPRDKVDIEKMYAKGQSALYFPIPPTDSNLGLMTSSSEKALDYFGTSNPEILKRNCEELY